MANLEKPRKEMDAPEVATEVATEVVTEDVKEDDVIEEGAVEELSQREACGDKTEAAGKTNGVPSGKNVKLLVIGIIAVIASSVIFTNLGKSLKTDDAVVEAKLAADEEYQEIRKEMDDARNLLAGTNVTIEKNIELMEQVGKYFADEAAYEAKLAGLKAEVTEKEDTLKRLTGDITKATGTPVKLPAGDFIVGEDIEASRYKITGNSNFIVYNSMGELKVNIILGGAYGVPSYVCHLKSGDMLRCSGSNTFTPIA